MEKFFEEDYSGLKKIVAETVSEARATGNEKFFDMIKFRDKMEPEFSKLGFREDTTRGGVDNILIVDVDALGEFIQASATIRELRFNYPYAYITIIVSSRNYEMAQCCPYVNEIILFDERITDSKNIVEKLEYVTDFAEKHLWDKRFSLGFNLRYYQAWHTLNTLLLYVSGAKERVGYVTKAIFNYWGGVWKPDKNPGNILLTHPVLNPKEIVHICPRILYILKSFGLQIRNTELELWYNRTDLHKAKKLLKDFAPDRVKVVLGTSASEKKRDYPTEKYLIALKQIIDKGAAIIIFGGSAEAKDAKFLQENLPDEYVINFTEILPGRRVEAAIMNELADIYLGNFTGSADMAAAAHLPCILLDPEPEYLEKTLYGLSYRSVFFPWQTPAIIVQTEKLFGEPKDNSLLELLEAARHPNSIDQIEPKKIVAAYDEMILFLKHSAIKKTACPPIIRSADATKNLMQLFD